MRVLLLSPLALLFLVIVTLRRKAYDLNLIKVIRLPVPVIVIGNITVGGTGKTPLILWLVAFLAKKGMHVGVVSRGYGRRSHGLISVNSEMSAENCGDEPWLIHQNTGCPVVVGANRVAAANRLLELDPDVQVILSDDGLQHYRLGRDVEVLVVDGERRFGNNLLLPAGPLREPASRISSVDAVVVNGKKAYLLHEQTYCMQLEGDLFYNLLLPEHKVSVLGFKGKSLHAVAGIGNPQRFFRTLTEKGLCVIPHVFPDHYDYKVEDFEQFEGEIIMTEKDAVKCRRFADERYWVFPVQARISTAFGQFILNKIKAIHGSKTH